MYVIYLLDLTNKIILHKIHVQKVTINHSEVYFLTFIQFSNHNSFNTLFHQVSCGVIWHFFCAWTALLRWRRCYWVATVSLLRSQCALIKTPSVHEHAQNARRRSAFFAMPTRCCGNVCDLTALTSAFWFFVERRETALVWQGYMI
jgi:hypothetical protein